MGSAAWEAAVAFVRDHAYAVIFVLTVILYNLGFARNCRSSRRRSCTSCWRSAACR
ncbi:hypothetical protein [Calditerricola satsumensis]|uniref:hypothetical protein n=1 Tax=Calditerricola satsumensis TaxID=373054 RepID=UPI001C48037C|nr:hypothetical protein [Calditerricola satsumensis]